MILSASASSRSRIIFVNPQLHDSGGVKEMSAAFVGQEVEGNGYGNGSERVREEKRDEEEEERDDVGLTSVNVTKDISHYLRQPAGHDDPQADSSDDEGRQKQQKGEEEEGEGEDQNEEKYHQQLESEEEEDHDLASYELVDDDYLPGEQEEGEQGDEEFGEFKEASHGNNDPHGPQVEEGNTLCNGDHETMPSSADYRVPPFSVNRSSIPPLTTGTVQLWMHCISSSPLFSIGNLL